MFKNKNKFLSMNKREKNKFNNLVVFLTFCLTFFLLWVVSSDYIKDFYVKNIDNWGIETNPVKESILWKNDLDLEKFWEVYSLLKQKYYSSEEVDKKTLVDWAISGLVKAVWDKHSEFLTKDEAEKFNEVLSWDFEGIWAVVEKVDFWVKIERVLKWSPAKKFWLFTGDIILEANGHKLEELDLYSAVEKIKWPAWTKVMLKIVRTWEKDFLNIEVTRDKINIPSIDYEIFKEDNIAYISLNLFWDNTSIDFEKALLEAKNADGLIIDLRDNWGWYLQSAVEILSNFLDNEKVIVTTKYKNSFKNFSYKSSNLWDVYDKKIVVLINENSASAAEIVAWALRGYGEAILVWKKTYGKWSVQEPFYMDDGSLLKITIAKWFTPKGKNIDKEGIEPDIEIDFLPEDYDSAYDRQLEEAKKILKNFTKLWALKLTVDNYNKK